MPSVPEQGPWCGMCRRHFSQRIPQTGDGFHTATHRARICMPKRTEFPEPWRRVRAPFLIVQPLCYANNVRRTVSTGGDSCSSRAHTLLRPRVTCSVPYTECGRKTSNPRFKSPSVYFPNGRRRNPVFCRFLSVTNMMFDERSGKPRFSFFTLSVLSSSTYLSMNHRYSYFCGFYFQLDFRAQKKNVSKHIFITSLKHTSSDFRTLSGDHGPQTSLALKPLIQRL